MLSDLPLPVVIGAVSNKRNEILLIRRSKEPYRNHWALPGGKWKLGESLSEALRREFLEETNHSLQNVQLAAIISETLIDENVNLLNHFLLFFCLCTTDTTKGDIETEAGVCCWFSNGNMKDLLIVPTDRKLIETYLLSQDDLSSTIHFYDAELQALPYNKYELRAFYDYAEDNTNGR